MHNNPLSFTDPTGHGLGKWVKRVVKKYGRTIVAVGAAFLGAPQIAHGLLGGGIISHGVAGGFIFGGVAGGNLKSAGYGAVGGGAFGFVGGLDLTYGQRVATHAATGGALSDWAGGDFRSGFVGAGFGAFASPYIQNAPGGVPGRVLAAGAIGGTAAHLAGGDFGSGFATAAFGRLFQQERINNRARIDLVTIANYEGREYVWSSSATGRQIPLSGSALANAYYDPNVGLMLTEVNGEIYIVMGNQGIQASSLSIYNNDRVYNAPSPPTGYISGRFDLNYNGQSISGSFGPLDVQKLVNDYLGL